MKMQKMKGLALLVGCGLLVGGLVAMPALAGEGRDGGDKSARKEMRKQRHAKFKAKRGEMFRKELGLADAKATQIEAKLDGFKQQSKAMRKAQRSLMSKLEALVTADSNDDTAYTATLKSLALNRTQMQATKKAKQEFMRQQLTPKQQAKLLVKMRSFKKGRRGHHRRGGKHHGKRGARGGNTAGF